MIHNIENTTVSEIENIVLEYRKAESILHNLEIEVQKLDDERKRMIQKIEDVREREKLLFQSLKDKHGPGRLDVLNMLYITKTEDYVDIQTND